MAKFIFFVLPEYGHVNPTLAVARELVARGEQVIYYLTEEFKTVVEATGSTFKSCAIPIEREEVNRQADQEKSADQQGVPLFFLQFMSTLVDTTQVVLSQIAEEVRAEQPDVIAYEYFALWGKALAHMLHIPALRFFASYAVSESFNLFDITPPDTHKEAVIEATNLKLVRLSNSYPLPSVSLRDLVVTAEPLNIVFLPRAFQFMNEYLDGRFQFVGASILDDSLANEALLEHFAGKKNLYISLGTIFNEKPDFFNLCIQAFGDTSWQVIISTGQHLDRNALQTVPANVHIASSVPQQALLRYTHVFLTHGGMNSVMESLYQGVPMVVIPQMMEQATTAQRLAELGLGKQISLEGITAATLREAIEDVAEHPSYYEAIHSMQKLLQEAGGYKTAADAISTFKQANLLVR